jgi:hypothetical protein
MDAVCKTAALAKGGMPPGVLMIDKWTRRG